MKRNKLIPFLLLPVLALSACGEVDARPEDYEKPLVNNAAGEKVDVANNVMDIIYDAKLEGGAVATEVLDEVLLEIAKSVFGPYDELVKAAAGTDADKDAFIAKYKVYAGEENEEAANKRTRLTNTARRIEDRIAKKMFKEISGSYTRNGYFYETDYLMSLRNSLKNVQNPIGLSADKLHDKVLITPDMDETNVFEKLLNKDNYEGEKFDYISKHIVPEIYRELLVEQYLFDSNYSAIGRAYAREVNIITINNRAGYPLFADALMDSYIDNYINANPATLTKEGNGFDLIETAWRGVGLDGVTAKANGTTLEKAAFLLNEAGSKKVQTPAKHEFTNEQYTYYTGTSYGDMVESLEKVVKNPNKTDTAKENEFTNNGEYTISQGVEVKTNKIKQETYVTDGWHIRNGGLTSLNETIRTRLFNIGVANALDNEEYPDRFVSDTKYELSDKENSYVAKINGRYFLKPVTSERVDNENFDNVDNRLKDMLWIDQAAGSFTIVEITKAVSSSKLALESGNNYADIYNDFEYMDTVAHEVAEVIATNDSYRTLSTKYWLEAADILYHDDTIYEYFNENFPELFEDK